MVSAIREVEALVVSAAPSTQTHRTWGTEVSRAGAAIARQRREAHERAIATTGIGLYYGTQSSFAKMNTQEKQTWLASNAVRGASLSAPPRASDCISFVLEVLGDAYRATGRGARWSQIEGEVNRHRGRGDVLARELQKDGWLALYWNPDTALPRDGNQEHVASARLVRRGKGYYGIRIDGRLENYAPSPGSQTPVDGSALRALERLPFFFGLARGGMHTFVGSSEGITELHWDRMPTSRSVIEQRSFAKFPWLSGVILVPPGTWPKESR